ncbi:hypothetical protein GA0115253_109922 [Streptomyces sp. Termitarium-T10T-6]|nr:hypothetical protein GA0115253_109922 [Streptomyces sp. Termitarium-T10T-6]
MFDAVARVRAGPQLLGPFQGVQGEVGGAVADGVDGELPAGQVAVDDEGGEAFRVVLEAADVVARAPRTGR